MKTAKMEREKNLVRDFLFVTKKKRPIISEHIMFCYNYSETDFGRPHAKQISKHLVAMNHRFYTVSFEFKTSQKRNFHSSNFSKNVCL